MVFRWLVLIAAVATTIVASAADDSAVVAESPRAKLLLADVEAEMAKLPQASRAQFAASRPRLVQMLDNLYLNRALANEARALGLDRDPHLARQIAIQVEKMLAQARLDRVGSDTKAAFDANPTKYEPRAREVYVANPGRFQLPEQVHVAHLLVKIGQDGDAAALTRAEALRARLLAGEKLADLAASSSDDPSAKRNKGDLGMVPTSKLDPAFAKAAMALNAPGELSAAIKSKFGYHIIQFKAKKSATVLGFDEVKAELLAEIGKNLVDEARTQYQGSMFEPKPTVNEDLVDRLHRDAQMKARQSAESAAPPFKR